MYLLEYNNKLVRKQGREKVKYVETGGKDIRADWAALSTTTMGHSVKLKALIFALHEGGKTGVILVYRC